MIRTWALFAVLISGALIDVARGSDLVECEPQRVTGDGRHWAYRIIDGRECWYPGRPGKPKNELYWGRETTPSARQTVDQPETETVPSEPPSRLVAAPPEKPEIAEAPGKTTNSCRPAADAAPASMRAPQACSFSPLTNNNTSHSRASSMHMTQWLDQASAVGSLLGELPGQSIQKI